MLKVKNLIFDLGRVVLKISPEATVAKFKELGINDFSQVLIKSEPNRLFDNFEKNIVTPNEFVSTLKQSSNLKIENADVISAWNAMIIGFPKERIALINELSRDFKLFLLSNTNIIHYNFYCSLFRSKFNYEFNNLFTKAFYSHFMGMRKPEPSIFESVLRNTGIKADETLFFDDNITNLKTAKSLGIHTQLIDDKYTLQDFWELKKEG